MCRQYLTKGSGLDHECLGAGERALGLLEEYGLVMPTPSGRGAMWTSAGLAFLEKSFRSNYPPDPITHGDLEA
jgi:hypothetical protein